MTCAKKRVICTIVTEEGERIVGENYCEAPQKVCPRLPNEDYLKCRIICKQSGHAETVALKLAGEKAKGATAYIEGHTHACRDCQEALYGAGVKYISVRDSIL